jgi:hypothetical protein
MDVIVGIAMVVAIGITVGIIVYSAGIATRA